MNESPELVKTEDGLVLRWEGMTLKGDFASMLPRVRPGRLGAELIVKAARFDRLYTGSAQTVLDATAGLGEDSFLLAAAGFNVILYERNRLIYSLLADALRRAAEDPETGEIASRMTVEFGDSIEAMSRVSPDVIYLDPMFPARKKSGLIKKKFQILQQLESPETDEKALIEAAMAACPRRIIIKRPAKAAFLGDIRPSYSIKGDTIRFDCLVLHP